jgi:hypothetical protein
MVNFTPSSQFYFDHYNQVNFELQVMGFLGIPSNKGPVIEPTADKHNRVLQRSQPSQTPPSKGV